MYNEDSQELVFIRSGLQLNFCKCRMNETGARLVLWALLIRGNRIEVWRNPCPYKITHIYKIQQM